MGIDSRLVADLARLKRPPACFPAVLSAEPLLSNQKVLAAVGGKITNKTGRSLKGRTMNADEKAAPGRAWEASHDHDHLDEIAGAVWRSTRTPRENLKAAPVVIPVSDLDEIARVVCVPLEHRLRMNSGIRRAAKTALLWENTHRIFKARPVRAPIRAIATTALQLTAQLMQLSSADRVILDNYLAIVPDWNELTGPEQQMLMGFGANESNWSDFWYRRRCWPIERHESIITEFAISALLAQKQAKRDSHRSKGSVKHPSLHELVRRLYISIVKEAHGNLGLWYDQHRGKLRGELPAVLDILRPQLPTVVPKSQDLSYSTLRRILKQAKKF